MTTQTISVGADDLVQIEQVGGDLAVQGSDGAELEARGELVRVERRTGSVAISCAGDLALSIPRAVHLIASTIGGDVRVEDLDGSVELGLVGGDAVLRNLSGSVRLGGMIGGDTHMENVSNMSMNSGNRNSSTDLGDRIRRTVEDATRRAERKIARAEHKAHKYAHMAARQADSARWGAAPDSGAPESAGDAVSEEERMMILKMLQDKKITSEQADQLLSALEGTA